MASGTGARPLPEPEEERELLGLGNLRSMTVEVTANTTKTFSFSTGEAKDGIVILSAANAEKRGLAIYGANSGSGNIALAAILSPSQSGLSIAASGRAFVVTNPSQSVFVCVMAFQGELPTVT